MKAISIRQPWADAILFLGKDIENRTWKPHFIGKIFVHAGKSYDKSGERFILNQCRDRRDLNSFFIRSQNRKGGIVGAVEIIDSYPFYNSPLPSKWEMGPICWRLKNPEPMNLRIQNGRLGFWEVRDKDEVGIMTF